MNTTTFIQSLESHKEKQLKFTLPDETILSGDLHISEIQHHSVDSIDCGGNSHSYNETIVQLWINERLNSEAEWTTNKALKIINLVGEKSRYRDDAELLIEFGDSKHPTIRYSIGKIQKSEETIMVRLAVKPTVCKPSLNAGKKVSACC